MLVWSAILSEHVTALRNHMLPSPHTLFCGVVCLCVCAMAHSGRNGWPRRCGEWRAQQRKNGCRKKSIHSNRSHCIDWKSQIFWNAWAPGAITGIVITAVQGLAVASQTWAQQRGAGEVSAAVSDVTVGGTERRAVHPACGTGDSGID